MKLSAKTHKGKNILKKWGTTWLIREIRQSNLLIFAQQDKTGSMSGFDNLPDSARWIKKSEDPDFQIVE